MFHAETICPPIDACVAALGPTERGRRQRCHAAALFGLLAALHTSGCSGCSEGETETAPPLSQGWVVFHVVPDVGELPMSDNLLENPDLEQGDATSFAGWQPYETGYEVDGTAAHSGARSARLHSAAVGESHGLVQVVTLEQTEPRPIYISGYSRAEGVTGEENSDYSIYVDVTYQDDTPLYGRTVAFPVGTTDWTHGERLVVPEKPIRDLRYYVMLRNTHAGSVWFDDLSLHEVQADVFMFEGQVVTPVAMDPYPYEGSPSLLIGDATTPQLEMTAVGGAITSVTSSGQPLGSHDSVYASGLFVRDVAGSSDYRHPGGDLKQEQPGVLMYQAADPELQLDLSARLDTTQGDRITVDVHIADRTGQPRALSVYFALPLDVTGWTWGDDIRSSEVVPALSELSNTIDVGYGATGSISRYPFASVSGGDGIALGYPLDHPTAVRFAANSATKQLYAAWDVALSPVTKEPSQAHWRTVLYRHDPQWGFRAAAKRYYELFPEAFEKRVDREGIWVAFSDLDPIPNIDDFGITFHERGGTSQTSFDDTVGVLTLRYISEGWSYWMRMDAGVPNDDRDQVMAFLRSQLDSSEERERNNAEATLSSGSFDEQGQYRFEPAAAPWCPYGAVFTLNADPDIADPDYPLNKAHLAWNDEARAIYDDPSQGVLDGEYVDSLESHSNVLDFRESHFAAADLPLVFDAESLRPAIPEIHATYEFVRWLEADIHGMGKLMMANGALVRHAFPAHLLDIMGRETNWLSSGAFQPNSDVLFNFERTLSYQKPYCLLMNTDFSLFTHEMVERYFKVALFYGIYPSMFSHNASEDRYWDDPTLVERDRDLFIQYIPLIRALGEAGWEPVTYAVSSDPDVYVERFGNPPSMHFTIRNSAEEQRPVQIVVEAEPLGLSAAAEVTFIDSLTGSTLTGATDGTHLTIADTLEPEDVRMWRATP